MPSPSCGPASLLFSTALVLASTLSAQPAQPAAGRGAGAGGRGALATLSDEQASHFSKVFGTDMALLHLDSSRAATRLAAASVSTPGNPAAIEAAASSLAAAELALANARAAAFATVQSGPHRLNASQVGGLVAVGGRYVAPGGLGFSPAPLSFEERDGYVSLFDGVTLKGWDGNPKFWRVEDGAIVGESSAANPSGHSYIVYRDIEAHDLNIKFEIKLEGAAGSGLQYRSKTDLPWLFSVPDAVTANAGAPNLRWFMTGPQADFWPSRNNSWTGQFYSENTPMRIEAPRGAVVEGFGNSWKKVIGSIGDSAALQSKLKLDDWNQYTVIARGGVFLHIINGQLMSVMVEDDPNSSNNWSGFIGFELEATGKVMIRNIWMKKFN